MTTTIRRTGLTWSQPDTGFYVASRNGEFVGTVDTNRDGSFVGVDFRGDPVGRFIDLGDAQRAVASTVDAPRTRARADRRDHMAATASVVTGTIAGALLMTAGLLAPLL